MAENEDTFLMKRFLECEIAELEKEIIQAKECRSHTSDQDLVDMYDRWINDFEDQIQRFKNQILALSQKATQ